MVELPNFLTGERLTELGYGNYGIIMEFGWDILGSMYCFHTLFELHVKTLLLQLLVN